MKRLSTIALLVVCFVPGRMAAGDDEQIHTLHLQGGGGFTYNVSNFDDVPEGLSSGGLFGIVRLMWQPEHLLSFGIESGFQRVYSVEVSNVATPFGTVSGSSVLNALPVMFVFSMPVIDHLELYAGAGFCVLYSTVEFLGDKTVANAYSPSFLGAASYLYPLSEDLRLGGEVRYTYFDRFVDQNIGIQVLLSYRLTSW
jgi:hypothetical protein